MKIGVARQAAADDAGLGGDARRDENAERGDAPAQRRKVEQARHEGRAERGERQGHGQHAAVEREDEAERDRGDRARRHGAEAELERAALAGAKRFEEERGRAREAKPGEAGDEREQQRGLVPRETQIGDRERNQRGERGRARVGDGDAHRQIGALAQATDGGKRDAGAGEDREGRETQRLDRRHASPEHVEQHGRGGESEGRVGLRQANHILRFPARFRPQPERGEDEEAGEARSSAGGGAPDGGPREQRRDEERADDPASAEKRRRNDPQGQDGEKRESAEHAMRERVDPGLLVGPAPMGDDRQRIGGEAELKRDMGERRIERFMFSRTRDLRDEGERPKDGADRGRRGEPGPALQSGEPVGAGHDDEVIGDDRPGARVLGVHEQRRRQGAHEPETRQGRPVHPSRCHGRDRDEAERQEGCRRPDEAINRMGGIDGGEGGDGSRCRQHARNIRRREGAGGRAQILGGQIRGGCRTERISLRARGLDPQFFIGRACVVDILSAQELTGGRKRCRQESAQCDSHAGAEEAALDRIPHQENGAEREREAADPHRPMGAEPFLEGADLGRVRHLRRRDPRLGGGGGRARIGGRAHGRERVARRFPGRASCR